MSDALFYLEHVLRSQKEPITSQEEYVLKAWKARVQRYFYLGSFAGSAVTWLATQRATPLLRNSLTLGTAAACGILLAARSVGSSCEIILSLEGTRLQRELASEMLRRHNNDPWVRRLVSKHFYPEEVYVDSSSDKPTFRWRYRNFSGETVSQSQSTTSEETNSKENKINKTPVMKPKPQVYATADAGTENPFDLVLGVSESANDAPTQPVVETSRRERRKEKRSRRRHRRLHRHGESDDD